MNTINVFAGNIWMFWLLLVWTLFWKGCALWFAVKRDEKWWFLALLVINTVGVLEIVYIFVVAKKKLGDIKALFTKPAAL